MENPEILTFKAVYLKIKGICTSLMTKLPVHSNKKWYLKSKIKILCVQDTL